MRDHEDLRRWYEGAVNASIDYRAAAERDRDYYDNKQWTDTEKQKLRDRKQPVITDNLIKRKVDTEIGIEIQTRVDVRAFPRTPDSEDAAESVTDSLRYIADNREFDQAKTEAAYNLVVEGQCAGIVEVEVVRGEVEVTPKHIPWDRFFIDPHSSRKDGRDARFMGQAIWMEEDEALEMYQGVDEGVITAGLEDTDGSDTYDDKPKNLYFDMKRRRVKVIEIYHREKGGWYRSVITGLGFVEPCKPSPYTDEYGDPVNPIIVRRAFLDRDNTPYGSVRQMISPQDEINKRKSKALHLLSVRQVIADVGAVDNVALAKRELNKPDGWITRNPGKSVDIQNTGDLAMGQFNLLQEAKQSIDAIGANAALAGKGSDTESGRALQVRQQAGVVELQPVFDGLRSWELQMYRQMWYRVKQFWNEEKWIRVTDDERNIKFVGLNKPVTLADQMAASGQPVDPYAAQYNPMYGQVVGIQNNVAELDVDLILETVPDAVTLQSETFEAFAQAATASGTQVPLEIWLELMPNVPNKRELMDKLNGGNMTPEEQQQRQAQEEQQQQREQQAFELEVQDKVSTIEERRAKTQKTMAEIRTEYAKAAKEAAEAQAQDIENDVVEMGLDQELRRVTAQPSSPAHP